MASNSWGTPPIPPGQPEGELSDSNPRELPQKYSPEENTTSEAFLKHMEGPLTMPGKASHLPAFPSAALHAHSIKSSTKTIATIAEKIASSIQVSAPSEPGAAQTIRITFSQNILPKTEVIIKRVDSKISISFNTQDARSEAFLSEHNLSSLHTSLTYKLPAHIVIDIKVNTKSTGDITPLRTKNLKDEQDEQDG